MAKDATQGGARLRVSKTYKLYIGGGFPRTESGRYYQINDARGGFVANMCRASRKDFRNATVAARKAQSAWAARTAFNRGQILYRMAEMLESRSASFVELLEGAGHNAEDARREVETSVDRLVWYAGWTDKFGQVFGSVNPVAQPFFNFTTPEAMGVVALFVAPSTPLLGLITGLAPLLVPGNTVVALVDGPAPHLAIELAEVLATSDLPAGVVNILTGHRSELLGHMGRHMDVDGIACWGADDATREQLGVDAAETVKRLSFFDDPGAEVLASDQNQSPYKIMPFVEFKTAWHPIGT